MMHLLNKPRRPHNKSRHGCAPCKRRHMKCDEQRPSCSLCMKRGSDCTYTTTFPRLQKDLTPQIVGEGERHQCDTLNPHKYLRISNMQRIRLFHHAAMSTAPSLATDEVDLRFWQWELPQIAAAHDYVMDGLLAVAALHLAFLEPDKLSSWQEVALIYQIRAIAGLREGLATNPQDYEATFAGSALVFLLVNAYTGICKDIHPTNPLSEFLLIRSTLRGCAMIFKQIYHGQEGTRIGFWVRRDRPIKRKEFQEVNAELVALHSVVLEKFPEVQKVIVKCQSPYRETYQSAYNLILAAFHKWPAENDSIIWPISISDSFLALVQQGDWIACVLFLFHGLGLHLASRNWYVKGAGRRLVLGVLEPLGDEIPPEWKGMTRWIRQAVEI